MKHHITPILAIVTTLCFFGYVTAITFIPHASDIGLVNVVLGWLGGTMTTVISYYFGSSSASEKKNDIIHSMKKND